MSNPFFTVAIPTKNRPDRVGDAVKSVLYQTFSDVEVVVCDNSDETEAAQTAAVVQEFGDPRVRYVRASGRLSMPDNWEKAIGEARGEFVGILTDRSVFRRNALAVVHEEILATGAKLVTWQNDLYGRDAAGTAFKRRGCTLKRYRFTSEQILDYFIHGHPKYSSKVVPKLMTSVCHRSILEAIRSSPAGRCCPPVAPDFTSGFLMLAHCDWVLTIDDGLYASVGTGNGLDFRRRGELAERFRSDLGMDWHEMVDRMPSEACFAHALVLNDLMRVRDMIPDQLPDLEVDRAQYYLGCLNDYVKTSRHGVTRDEDLAALLETLEQEPSDVKEAVQTKRLFVLATRPAVQDAKKKVKVERVKKVKPVRESAPAFDHVFDALAWAEANPRTATDSTHADLSIGLDQMKVARRTFNARARASRAAKSVVTSAKAKKDQPLPKPGKAKKKKKKKPLNVRLRRTAKQIRKRARLRTRLREMRR